MNFKVKGIILAIGDKDMTSKGTSLQKIDFQQENGRIYHPNALGLKTRLLDDFSDGDEVEIEFYIEGSKSKYNNVKIENIVKI